MKSQVKLVTSGILLLILLVVGLFFVKIVTIDGNQLGVEETWSGGVSTNILFPKTYVLFPGFTYTVYKYDASLQKFVMNDLGEKEGEKSEGRAKDSYKVQSQEGQDMTISMNLQWRIDPTFLVQIHKTVGPDIQEKIIRPALMRVVKDAATTRKAIDAYSGEGLVSLQREIQTTLSLQHAATNGEPTLAERGIIVGNFVIEHIDLDPKYIDEIKMKQIAVQQQLRAVEEQKAAEAQALVAKAVAQADANKQIVDADRAKQVTVLKAEADNQQAILAAQAEKQKQTLEAEGKEAAMEAIANGTLAQGKAVAAANELLLKSYSVAGSDSYVKVKVAEQVANAFSNIKGYLPTDMKVNLLTGNFLESVDSLTGNPIVTPPARK